MAKKGKSKPWDRRVREKARYFAYFNQYLDLGVNRTLRKLHDAYPETVPKYDRLKQICAKWDWIARAEAYDTFVVERNRKSRLREMDKFMTEEWNNARTRVGVVNENIQSLHTAYEEGYSKTSISHALKSNSSAYKEGIEVMLRLAGMPSTINQNINDTSLEAKVDNRVSISDKDLLDEVKELEDKMKE